MEKDCKLDILKEIVRTGIEGPVKYLRPKLFPVVDVLTLEEEAQAYVGRIWGMPRENVGEESRIY